jgi:CRP-like cAMP-binding protein
MADIAELKNIPILGHLSKTGLRKLVDVATEKELQAGAIIFEERSEDDSLFIILSGRVRITKATTSGGEKKLATLNAGAFFGEMTLFDDFVRSATAKAATNVRLLEIRKDAFMQYLASDAEGASKLMLEIMRAIAPRIRQTNRENVALYEAGRIIGEHAPLGAILSNLLKILADATWCTCGAVFLLNTPTGMLECRAAFGHEADPSEWSEPLEGGITGVISETDDPVRIENFQDDPRFEGHQPVGYETPSMLTIALRSQAGVIGIIVLGDKVDLNGNPVPFTSGDANLLAGIAAQATGAIESARVYEEAQEKEKLDRVYFRY